MKQQITIDGVTLTRAQVEAAYAALQEPEVDRNQPVRDRITVFHGRAIQVPRHMVEDALRDSNNPYVWIGALGNVGAVYHVPDDHDLPTLTGFTSAPKEI